MSKERRYDIDWLRVIAMMAVFLFHCTRFFDMEGYRLAFRRPIFAEVVSTCLVLVGVYPSVNLLTTGYIALWATPFGFDLSYPPLWGALCLAALAGTLVTSPYHLGMVRRGVIAWGVAPAGLPRGLAWNWKGALMVLSFAAMLGAIFLSMRIA